MPCHPHADLLSVPLGNSALSAVIDAAEWETPHVVTFRDGTVWEGRACDRKWKPLVRRHTTYAVCNWERGDVTRELRLHRLITDAPAGVLVDHENGDGLDNRRENLRLTDAVGNARNRRAIRGRYVGVALHKLTGKWEAYVKVCGKKVHLGLHPTAEEAARARDRAARRHYGEFARLNLSR